MAVILQDGGHLRHENHFLASLIQTCAILMIGLAVFLLLSKLHGWFVS